LVFDPVTGTVRDAAGQPWTQTAGRVAAPETSAEREARAARNAMAQFYLHRGTPDEQAAARAQLELRGQGYQATVSPVPGAPVIQTNRTERAWGLFPDRVDITAQPAPAMLRTNWASPSEEQRYLAALGNAPAPAPMPSVITTNAPVPPASAPAAPAVAAGSAVAQLQARARQGDTQAQQYLTSKNIPW